MCELFAMSCDQAAMVNYSLEAFSKHGGLTSDNKDGWGICYYDEGDIRLIKEAAPAAGNPWVDFIAGQQLASHTVIAHVRLASRGHPKLENTHPFERELGGRRHVFAHNGTLVEVQQRLPLTSDRFRPIGETDSEHAFCVLLERLHPLWWAGERPPSLEVRLAVFADLAAQARALGQANFLYSDGDTLFVHAHKRRHQRPDGSHSEPQAPGLHLLRNFPEGHNKDLSCDGLTVKANHKTVLYFASVPVTEDAWEPLDEGLVLAIRQGREVARRTAA